MKPEKDDHLPVLRRGGPWDKDTNDEVCHWCGAARSIVDGKCRPWRKGGLAVPTCPGKGYGEERS